MTNANIKCKYCHSANVVKYGTFGGIQRYWCKDCKRKFVPDTLPKMKTPTRIISSALSCYFGGMPLDAIQRHLQQQFGVYYSESGIYNWVIRFSKEAIDRTKDFQPIVGNTWLADETVLKVGGKNIWFIDVIDLKSRYLLASRLSKTRTIKDIALVMKEAYKRAGKTPERIITDKWGAYVDGIELVFGADTEHIQSTPFVEEDSTNVIERFQGTLKDRTKVVRGFKNMDTARLLTEAWLVHYNFFKEHSSLGDTPPALKMDATPIRDWNDVVTKTTATLTPKPKSAPVTPARTRVIYKTRHPKRKPKGLKRKAYTEVRLIMPRIPR